MGLYNTKYKNARDKGKKKMENKLLNCCKMKDSKGVSEMLKCGVPPDIHDKSNPRAMTPLMCVPYYSMYVRKPKRKCYYNYNRKKQRLSQYRIVHFLIQYNADVSQADAHGKTVLHHFAGGGQLRALKLLLDTGTDVNVIDPNTGNSPLHYACMSEESSLHVPILKMLLEYGANPDIKNLSNETALHICAIGNKTEMAEMLLQYSANVNLVKNKGDTPLHCCCGCTPSRKIHKPLDIDFNTDDRWYSELAQSLLRNGADINILNIDGDSVLQLCIKYLRKGRLQWQCFCPSQKSNFNCKRYDKSSLSLLKAMIKVKDIDPNTIGNNASPLYCCYSNNCTGDITDQYLFKIGANPNLLVRGKPALHSLLLPLSVGQFKRNHDKSVEFALKQNIKLNIQAGLDLKLLPETKFCGITKALVNLKDRELLEMVRLTGYKLFNTKNRYLQMERLNSENGFSWSEIIDAENEPLSLQQIASNVIRISLKPNAIKGVDLLNLPPNLRAFINFQYVSPVMKL